MDSHASVWPFNFFFFALNGAFCGWPGLGVALQLEDTDSHPLARLFELEIRISRLWRGFLILGDGLPRFGVALRVADRDSHALAWSIDSGIRTVRR